MGGRRAISRVVRPRTGLLFTIVLSALIHLVLFGLLGYHIAAEKEEIVIFSPPYSVSLVSGETPGEGGEDAAKPSEKVVDTAAPILSTGGDTVTLPVEKKTEEKKEAVKEEKKETKPQEKTETTGDLASAVEKIRKKVEMEEQKKKKDREAKEKAQREREIADSSSTGTRETPSRPTDINNEGTRPPAAGKPGGGNPYGYDNVFAAGGSGRGVPDAEFSAYYAEIYNRIRSFWAIPEGLTDKGLLTVYDIRIGRDGRILEVWLEEASGNAQYDDSALRAIKKADPLPPLPEKYTDSTMDVGIRFHPEK